MPTPTIPCFFHEDQLEFKPRYEWAFGEKITHPETTARAESILAALGRGGERFDVIAPPKIPYPQLRALHQISLMTLYSTAEGLSEDEDFYPSVFPKLKRGQADPTNIRHAGAFCFDSGTPLNSRTLQAAGWSAACAHSAALAVRSGKTRLAYALSRPPGHHAERGLFGGYCYFNNSALAARELKKAGRVAIVDIDFHHGNGTQDLFLRDDRVFTISLHGDPREFFPFYVGFPTETGHPKAEGLNMNLVLEADIDGAAYLAALEAHVLPALEFFAPDFLIVAMGLDGYVKDPIGQFALTTEDFHRIGERLGAVGLPTVAVQEGGYYTPHLGRNAVAALDGLRTGAMHRP